MSVNNYSLLRGALITERSTQLREKYNQYVFKVAPGTTKPQVKEAVEKIFKVNVEKIQSANFTGKLRRQAMGRPQGRRISWKKMIVKLKKGQEIKMDQELV